MLSLSTILYAESNLKPYQGNINPGFELIDLQGEKHTLSQYKDSVVLVQFWATYCPTCIKEVPHINALQKQMKHDNINFKVLAINFGESREDINPFVKQHQPEYTILLDESGESMSKWNVFGTPASFLIDKNTKIRYSGFGALNTQELIDKITALEIL